jgi:hypothetical protein
MSRRSEKNRDDDHDDAYRWRMRDVYGLLIAIVVAALCVALVSITK